METKFQTHPTLPFPCRNCRDYGFGNKEQALKSITLKSTAKILGIEETTGSIEVRRRDANIFISTGDVDGLDQ